MCNTGAAMIFGSVVGWKIGFPQQATVKCEIKSGVAGQLFASTAVHFLV